MNLTSIIGENSILKRMIGGFLRLNIAKKMIIGYLPLAILIIFIAVFALSNLNKLNKINSSIISTDVPLIDTTDKLIDNLIAQELYGRRYLILKSDDMLMLFWKRSEEFDNLIQKIRELPNVENIPIDELVAGHNEYNEVFLKGIKQIGKSSSTISKDYDSKIKNKQEHLIELIKKISFEVRNNQNKKILMTANIGNTAFLVTAIVCTFGIVFGVSAAVLITRNISGSVRRLELATKEVSEGRFEYIHAISNEDELGELSHAFGEMTKRLKRLEEMYLDMSPLTRLPGGLAIENVLKKRLNAALPLAFCLIDMDNFKAYNDRYGYAKGSELIKATAQIIESVVSEQGTHEDFIGHIGGDDFVVVSAPDRYINICKAINEAFDKMIPEYYDPEDRNRGYIIGKTRQGNTITFPLMTISIAVVTNQHRTLTSPAQVGEIAAELKEYAKSLPGSIYVVDKRRDTKGAQLDDKLIMFRKEGDKEKKIKDA